MIVERWKKITVYMHSCMSIDIASVSSYTRVHLYHFCLGWQEGVHSLSSLEDLEVFSVVVLQVVSRWGVLALHPTLEIEMLLCTSICPRPKNKQVQVNIFLISK